MHTFKDSTGASWEISINLGTAMAVRDKLGIDLLQPEQGEPPLLTRIGSDEVLLGEVILALIEDQMKAKNVSEPEVYKRFTGEVILAAQKAFYDELVLFFQSRGRKDRATAVEKQRELIVQAVEAAAKELQTVSVEKIIDGEISGKLQELSG